MRCLLPVLVAFHSPLECPLPLHYLSIFFKRFSRRRISFSLTPSLHRSPHAVVEKHSRASLWHEIARALTPPQGVEPTPSHLLALSLFDVIVTTNYDDLFERAIAITGDSRVTICDEIAARTSNKALIKLHDRLKILSHWS